MRRSSIKRIEQKGMCVYCKDHKIHPAFVKEELCSGCASDCFEDFKKRIDIWKISKSINCG